MTHRSARHGTLHLTRPTPRTLHPVPNRNSRTGGLLQVSVRTGDPCSVIQVAGAVSTHAAAELRTAMQKALATSPGAVVVDLIASEADDPFRMEPILVLMQRHARRFGAALIIAAPAWLRDRVGTASVLTITPSITEALDLGLRSARRGA